MPRFYQEMFNFACVTPAGTILNNWSDLIFSDFCMGKKLFHRICYIARSRSSRLRKLYF